MYTRTHITHRQGRAIALLALLICAAHALAGIPQGYYSKADGLKKEALKLAMRDIAGKAKVLSYGSGSGHTWDGFYTTDRMEGNQVRDRYSYGKFYFTLPGAVPSGMNIEHSFPKSWWGGAKNQAYQDLFNPMPSDSKANSAKSNYVMGKVKTASYDNSCILVGKDDAGQNVWEPADEWKGDFARNYFYMATVYSQLTWTSAGLDMLEKDDWPTLKPWAYTLLLQWSRQDPVDEIEQDRNEAVYGIQGNRNPFIDYPNLAEYIWGDSTTYAFSVDGSQQGGGVTPDEPEGELVLADADFTSSTGEWTVKDVSLGTLTSVWTRDSRYSWTAKAYVNKVKYATESWLVSPDYDLTGTTQATFTFAHTGQYFGTMAEDATLWTSTDGGEHWEQMDIDTYMNGTNWTFVTSTQDLTALCGHHVRLAFRYTSSTEAADTWEIKTVRLTAVKATDMADTPVAPMPKAYTRAYDLSGRPVPDWQRGLVIQGGRKVLRP